MQTFALFTEAGAPLLGAAPAFLVYADATGTARQPPAINEMGGGLYGFAPSQDDEHAGTAYLIDGGPAASPRYYSGAVGLLVAFAFYGPEGAPLAGLAPTFARYTGASGEALEQPAIVELGGGLYGFMPSQADRAAQATYLVLAGGDAEPAYYSGTVPLGDPQPVIPDVREVRVAERLLSIEQGATWKHVFRAQLDHGRSLNLTGYEPRMQIRSRPGGELYASPVLAITDPAAGEITAYLSAEETALFHWRHGSYDLDVAAGDVVLRLYRGAVQVLPKVTS